MADRESADTVERDSRGAGGPESRTDARGERFPPSTLNGQATLWPPSTAITPPEPSGSPPTWMPMVLRWERAGRGEGGGRREKGEERWWRG